MALGAMIARRGFDLDARKELEQLRENTTYSIQGGIPHSLRLLSEKPIQASRDSALLAQTLIWTSLRHCRVSLCALTKSSCSRIGASGFPQTQRFSWLRD